MSKPFKTYEGVPITVGEDGRFYAEINGEEVSKPTLAQIEKAIKAKPKFTKFPVYEVGVGSWEHGKVVRKVILGTITRTRGWSAGTRWIVGDDKANTERSESSGSGLYKLEPEVVEIARDYREKLAVIDKEIEKLSKQSQALRGQFVKDLQPFEIGSPEQQ